MRLFSGSRRTQLDLPDMSLLAAETKVFSADSANLAKAHQVGKILFGTIDDILGATLKHSRRGETEMLSRALKSTVLILGKSALDTVPNLFGYPLNVKEITLSDGLWFLRHALRDQLFAGPEITQLNLGMINKYDSVSQQASLVTELARLGFDTTVESTIAQARELVPPVEAPQF